MKRVLIALSALGLALGGPRLASAQDPGAVFKPTGNWTADYGDDYCRLIRTFSDGKNELSLALERTQPGAPVKLVFVGDGLKPFRGADRIGYKFAPSGSAGQTTYARSETTDHKQFLSFDPVLLATPAAPVAGPPLYDRAAELESAGGITAIALTDGLTAPVTVETGSLRAPIGAMQACTDDLLKVWGLDPERHKTMTAPLAPNPAPNGVLPGSLIPFTEFAKFAGGSNQVRLLVGADGKPTSCTIYSPSLSASLNQRICSVLMEKAMFQPAKDAAGQPMASFWMGPPFLFGPPPPGRR